MSLYRVIHPKFVAGYRTDENGVMVEAAPILRKWIMGKTWLQVLNKLHHYRVEFIS